MCGFKTGILCGHVCLRGQIRTVGWCCNRLQYSLLSLVSSSVLTFAKVVRERCIAPAYSSLLEGVTAGGHRRSLVTVIRMHTAKSVFFSVFKNMIGTPGLSGTKRVHF